MRRAGDDDGSISIEYVLLTPLIFLVLALIYAFARVTDVGGNLDSATRDAARVATQAPTRAAAQTAAEDVVATQMAGVTCTNNPAGAAPVVVLSPTGDLTPGETLTVNVECVYSISDLGLPGAPGTIDAKSQFSSTVDPNRSLG